MKTYWASEKSEDLVKTLGQKIKSYNRYIEDEGLLDIWEMSFDMYFGKQVSDSLSGSKKVNFVGEDGELTAFSVNRYRNNIRHVLALTTAQKPSFDVRAKTTDIDAQNQARLGNAIVTDYVQEKRLGRYHRGAVERALIFGKGYVYLRWDPSLGRPWTTKDTIDQEGNPVQKVVYEGDIEASSKSPIDVIYDVGLRDWKARKWEIVREWENKWDLAAKHPEKADAILDQSRDELCVESTRSLGELTEDDENESDFIAVYYFYHLRSDGLPSGRFMKFISGETWLYDGPMQYRTLPCRRVAPGEIFDSSEGYTEAHDLIALQNVFNILHSTAFTNQQATAVQMLWLPDGCNFSSSQFKGLAVLKGGAPDAQPRGIALTNTPAEIYKNREDIKNEMREIMGLNSAITGDPGTAAKSGVALAKMQAMAVQYSSTLQASSSELMEDIGTGVIHLLQDFAKTERIVASAGKMNRTALKSFNSDSINMLDKVVVDLGNPMSNTISGRIEMAENLLAKGQINPREYIQVINTGQLEAATQSEDSEKYLIQQENESLLEGTPVRAITGDSHLLHAKEHKVIANDPELRRLAALGDPKALSVIEATLNHIAEHEQLWASQVPFYAMMSGEPLPPPPPPPMPPPPGAPTPEQGPPPPPSEALPPAM